MGQIGEGLLSAKEAEECISSEFNPVRAGFHGGTDVWTQNVLNLGIRPDRIIAKVSITDKIGNLVVLATLRKGKVKVSEHGLQQQSCWCALSTDQQSQ